MKKKIEGLFLLILFFFLKCTPKLEDKYIIKGSIAEEHEGEMVMLFTLSGDSIITVDTTIIKNGAFRFQGKEHIRDFSVITTGNFPEKVLSTEVILERGIIKVHLDSISVVSGPFLQSIYESFQDSSIFLRNEIMKTFQITNGKPKVIDDSAFNHALNNEMRHALRILKVNSNNAIGKRAFGYIYQMEDEVFYSIYDLLDETSKSDPDIIFLINDRLREKSEKVEKEKRRNTVFQDFDLLTLDGTTKRISDYVGKSKYLFIDFWASWCGPCIADFQHLKAVYDIYHEKGFNILGISFDTSETTWKKSVETYYIPWETVMVKNEKEMRVSYAISGIPYGILLDDKGIIVEVGVTGVNLAFEIRKYFE